MVKKKNYPKVKNKIPILKNYQYKIIRTMTGFSQKEIVENIGMSRTTMNSYENNKKVTVMPVWLVMSLIDLVERNIKPDAWVTIVEMYNTEFPDHIIKDYK